ncbi:MAG: metal ABC transporter substrate-binding protein [Lachnospiraceae bacterium]|nr:metal ABC transporter substrate-binding protein [Lachnospiraceae bacterium]
MKKIISAIVIAFYAVFCLAGCAADATGSANNGKISVVTTIFPEYDWVKNIMGDKAADADVTMLLDNGVDLHSYQPTAMDIAKISDCDLFIYVGGESDGWVEDALSEATNKDMVVINLLETLGSTVKSEEIKEGMEHVHDHEEGEDHDHEEGEDHDHEEGEDHDHEEGEDHDHEEGEEHDHEEGEDHDHEEGEDHDHEEGEEHDHEHEHESDEHVWLSLKNAAVICEAIEAGLEKADAANADTYKANLATYKAELAELDAQYAETVDGAAYKTLLFGDRFPFRYMVDDYGIDYFAAFTGCSAETEASFETIVFLAGKVDELGLKHVMKIEGTATDIADTVVNNTANKDQDVLTLDSMQSTTSRDVAAGTTYLSVMKSNLEVLKTALN